MFEGTIIFMVAFTAAVLSMLASLRTKVFLELTNQKREALDLDAATKVEGEQVLAAARHAVRKTLAYAKTFWVMTPEQYGVVRQLKDGDGSFVLEYVNGETLFMGKSIAVVHASISGRDISIVSYADAGFKEDDS